MGIKPDRWIRRMAREAGLIEPFVESLVRQGVISYGPSSYGYDFRLGRWFKVFRKTAQGVVDPKSPDPSLFEDIEAEMYLVPAGGFVVARSLEYFRIPREVVGVCYGKSTYARLGVLVNVTPLEPEWEGHLTFSVANLGSQPVRLYAGEGIAQLLFLEAAEVCEISYRDRRGKYQGQAGVVLSRVDDAGS